MLRFVGRSGRSENGARDGGYAWYGDFAGERGVTEDLRCSVEVTERVSGDDHDGFLRIAVVDG